MHSHDKDSDHAVWVPGLAEFLAKRSDLDALMVDVKRKKISIATVGEIDEEEFKQSLRETIHAINKEVQEGTIGSDKPIPEGLGVKKIRGKTLIEKNGNNQSLFREWRVFPWPEEEEVERWEHFHEEDWRLLSLLALGCFVFGIAGFLCEVFDWGPVWLHRILYTIGMISGGWHAARDVAHTLPKGELDVHFLMIAVAVGASAIGALREGALLLFLFSVSGAMENLAKHKTRSAIDSLFKTAPKTALVWKDEKEIEVPIDDVMIGMEIIVKPGQLFPIDGEVISGDTASDESNITGESKPIAKKIGDSVYSGTMNLWGAVHVRVVKAAKESSLQKIINLIEQAQHLKAPSQRFADKFGTPYTYGIVSLVTVMFFVWWLGFGVSPFKNELDNYSAFYRAMTLLVVASPCALILSVPSAILAAIAWGATHGVLFRGGAAIEKLSEIDIVALDKTGTLTMGELRVEKIESFPHGREQEVAELAYSLERKSNHPIARAIVTYGKAQGLKEQEIGEFRSITGSGVQGKHGGATAVLGRRSLLEMGPLAKWAKDLPPVEEQYTEVWVVYEGLIGRLLLKDMIRKESKPVMENLRGLGIKTLMLTGDRRETAERVGKEIGIQEVRAGLKPEEKVDIIAGLAKKGHKVAMVGDGVNDAPSLAAAFVPVAMGVRGSDAALEQSEVILMNDRIDYFLDAYQLSLRARKIIHANLIISLLSIGVMVCAGTFGIVPLTLGVITHEGSTVFVCLNSLRLLYKKK